MGAIHLRALRNGAVAALVTAVVGFALNSLFTSGPPTTSADEPGATPSTACEPRTSLLDRTATAGLTGRFEDVWMDVPDDGWAVGWSGNVDAEASAVIARWDGSSWEPSEDAPDTTSVDALEAVDGTAFDDVWAVGWSSDGFGRDALAVHYDGTSWQPSAVPTDVALTDVRALAPNDVWAVGSTGDPDLVEERAIALHWDGTTWTAAALRVGGGRSGLAAIGGTTDDLWAAGYHHRGPLLMHYDGTTWARTDVDAHGPLNAVSAADGTVWVAGTSVLRGDGSSFSEVVERRRGGSFSDLLATGSSTAWAVGTVSKVDASHSLVLLVDGDRGHKARLRAAGDDAAEAIGGVGGGGWIAGWRRTARGEVPLVATLRGCD